RAKLGTLVIYMAAGLTLMVLIPNPLWGRLLFLACAASVFAVGYGLKKSAKLDTQPSSKVAATTTQ
ncbi:TPA: transporter, partial [Vibrio parahaemolyticus]|nr:transporter [Vibrio parahaemolyticus]HCG5122254.1 transporter [Vibrio parahaemolyticus]